MGSITYTEGISDDLNKFIWCDQDWDPGKSTIETLRDYSRFFISADYADSLAQGFAAQERNWEGPLLANPHVQGVTSLQTNEMRNVSSENKNAGDVVVSCPQAFQA